MKLQGVTVDHKPGLRLDQLLERFERALVQFGNHPAAIANDVVVVIERASKILLLGPGMSDSFCHSQLHQKIERAIHARQAYVAVAKLLVKLVRRHRPPLVEELLHDLPPRTRQPMATRLQLRQGIRQVIAIHLQLLYHGRRTLSTREAANFSDPHPDSLPPRWERENTASPSSSRQWLKSYAIMRRIPKPIGEWILGQG